MKPKAEYVIKRKATTIARKGKAWLYMCEGTTRRYAWRLKADPKQPMLLTPIEAMARLAELAKDGLHDYEIEKYKVLEIPK